jgi:hypothetical protein
MVILAPKKEVEFYRFDRYSGDTVQVKSDDEMMMNSLGYYQGGNILYKNRLHGNF